jgi:hypothetical protein
MRAPLAPHARAFGLTGLGVLPRLADAWVALLSGAAARPTYQEIEAALVAADVPFRFTEFDEIV